MRRSREQVLKILQENREALHRYGARRLGLFGSCARDAGTEVSDLDFVVELEEKSFDAYMNLKEFLEELFECRVDLVLADTIKPRLRTTILAEAVHVPGL